MKGQLSHQDEQRDYRQVIRAEHGVDILCHEIHCGIEGHKIAEPYKSDYCHDKTHGHSRKYKDEKSGDADYADDRRTHCVTVLLNEVNTLTASTAESMPQPMAMPNMKG